MNVFKVPATKEYKIEDSLVNIFCSQKIGNLRKTITGSGVLIDNEGTVLTNAHVAEYPLIADTDSRVVCIARTGSPALKSHSVKVLFISPEWINKYGAQIEKGFSETGESDYALLTITPFDKANDIGRPLALLPTDNIQTNSSVQALSYPADTLGTNGANSPLNIQKENLHIINPLQFSGSSSQVDVFDTNQSILGQHGSSGGAITQDSKLIGLINRELAKYNSSLTNVGSLKNLFNLSYRSNLTLILTQGLFK